MCVDWFFIYSRFNLGIIQSLNMSCFLRVDRYYIWLICHFVFYKKIHISFCFVWIWIYKLKEILRNIILIYFTGYPVNCYHIDRVIFEMSTFDFIKKALFIINIWLILFWNLVFKYNLDVYTYCLLNFNFECVDVCLIIF
jgi:hypothetical protein